MTTPDPSLQDPNLPSPTLPGPILPGPTFASTTQPGYPLTAGYPVQQPMVGYPIPAYGQQAYGMQFGGMQFGGLPVPRRNGMGTAALVLGIIAVVTSWSVFGLVLGILAIIFGSVGMGRVRRGQATNRGSALAGLVLGIVALALLVLMLVSLFGTFRYGL